MRMILADDEPVITRGIQKLIDWKSLGIEIAGVYETGKAAFNGIVEKRPDIALLDVSMPEMTGIEILKELSLMELDTKVIFISGFQDFEYAKGAIRYGAVDYLLKPVIREELLNAIEKCTEIPDEPQLETEEIGETERQDRINYAGLLSPEDTSYVPCTAQIFFQGGLTSVYRGLLEEDMKAIQEFAEKSDNQSFRNAKDYIEKHYAETVSLQIIADEIHMNPYYFSAFFKKNAGENFKSYLSRVRVEHAIPLLIKTDKKISDLAADVGFSDARTFTDAFQKLYHETPGEYRKRMRGK